MEACASETGMALALLPSSLWGSVPPSLPWQRAGGCLQSCEGWGWGLGWILAWKLPVSVIGVE